MSDLRDFFQGASNSIASNVSAPVDGIAWLLRKAGVPVPPNPMGGSDWMAEKGLTQQPQNRTAGLLGEFAGMAGPMVAAAKAPQIAKGLLSLDDKAMDMGRTAIENHMVKNGMIQPATVWHGSPHKFNKFDSSKIGTGEGAQAYGHGLYLAESPAVAREYQQKLSSTGGAKNLAAQYGDVDKGMAEAQRRIASYKQLIANGGGGDLNRANSMLNIAQKNLDDLTAMKAGLPENTGALYKVDLPDEHIAKMLDWDKPLSQQAPEVRSTLNGIMSNEAPDFWKAFKLNDRTGGRAQNEVAKRYGVPSNELSLRGGEGALRAIEDVFGKSNSAADLLRKQGIPGIRYLDGGSRGAGTGSSNFVVFPGNEGLLKILERNGQPLNGLLD